MTNSCSESKVMGASVWDWRTQYPDSVGRGAYCNAPIICVQPQRLEHIEGKHSWPPECLQTVGLCFTLWPFNFWRNARRDVSVKIRSEESVTIGYHSPGGRAVGCPLFGESSLLTGCESVALQMIHRWQRACLLLGGEPQSNKCNRLSPCLTHWFGIKHLCALCWCWYHCGLQLFIATQPRKLWISRSHLDSLRFPKQTTVTDHCPLHALFVFQT